jgi:lipopolysaccharide transport protein LptA
MQWAKAYGNLTLQQKNEGDVTVNATADQGEYFEIEQKASLVGSVHLTYTSPSMAGPTEIWGARADTDLKSQQSVVTRSPKEPVKTVMRPKAQPGSSPGAAPAPRPGQPAPPPAPVVLESDRVEADARTNTYTATGNPVLTQGKARLTADRLVFIVDPATNDLKEATAAGNMVFDNEDAQGGKLHATGDKGAFDGPSKTLTVTGNVVIVHTPREGGPRTAKGNKLTYNTQTGAHRLEGSRSTVTIPSVPRPMNPPGGSGSGGSGGRTPGGS